MAPEASPKDAAKGKAQHDPAVASTQPAAEEEDVFEEFCSKEWAVSEAEKDGAAALWEPHWDDEDVGVDFHLRLKEELDRGMKE